MAINIGKNSDGDVTYQNPPVNRVLFPNIKEGASTEEIQEAVNAWLDEHPEATTTVEDGSILPVKLDSSNSASDGYVLSYNATAGKFEWYDVGGELDEINSDITDLKQDLKFNAELKDGYIAYHTGEVKASTTRKYSEFQVAYGMSVIYRFHEGAVYNFGIAFYNEYGIYISGNIVQSQDQTIPVPEGAVLCKATVANISEAVPVNYNYAIQKNAISAKNAFIIDKSSFEYIPSKYAYYNEARVANYTGVDVLVFPVYEGMKFIYSTKNSNPNVVGMHFRDSSGNFVSGVQATANPATVTVPFGACVCYASVYGLYNVTFIEMGNTALAKLSETPNSIGLKASANPLEVITDHTGMLDIFLNVGCIGDSLASGESYWNDGGTTQGNDFYQYSWGQYLARKTGNKYYNWSHGGLSTKLWLQSEYTTECFDGDHLCEAYIIGLGQNDANYDYTIGTSADIDLSDYNNNADTFYGSYGKIIQKIKEVQPQAKIFVITDPNASTNTKGYNTAIAAMATIFDNVYLIDMYTYGYQYVLNQVIVAQGRAGHYNAYGYKLFAMMIANYIDWIITTNYTEFTQVELIGTGYSWT